MQEINKDKMIGSLIMTYRVAGLKASFGMKKPKKKHSVSFVTVKKIFV